MTEELRNQPFQFRELRPGVIEASSPYVHLRSWAEPMRFEVTMRKQPIELSHGMQLDGVEFDWESQTLADTRERVGDIRQLPERERPRKLVELVRSKIVYPYAWVMQELKARDPQKAGWVEENIEVAGHLSPVVKLSELLNNGFGECRHFAASFIYMAHEAGLTVAFCSNGPDSYIGGGGGPINNVYRRDDGEKLFKSCEVGKSIWAGHAWAEVLIDDEWMPVDPTTRLVGDNLTELQTFRDADYRARVLHSLDIDHDYRDMDIFMERSLDVPVTAKVHAGTFTLNSRQRSKPSALRNPEKQAEYDNEQWPQPTQHQGPFTFTINSLQQNMGMNIMVVSARELN